MDKLVENFLDIYDGYEEAYGQHGGFKAKENGKMEGRANTVVGKIKKEVVEKHLNGDGNGLGIVPLKQDNTVRFGAIDIDIVGINPLVHTIEEIESKIDKLGLPMIPCTTKSGGVHCYVFTSEPVPAELLIKRIKEWASLLGYGSCEIFPKQLYRINEQDIGNWINLPYYDYKESKRVAYNKQKPINIEDFFELVDIMRVSAKELEDYEVNDMDNDWVDAPPCIQILKTMGIEDGSRNNGIYNIGVYLKKKNPDNWQEELLGLNGEIVTPALSGKEIEAIIKSVNKRDFFYKCNEYPLCQFCNKNECRKRKFGIGTSHEAFKFDNITKYIAGDEVVWFAEYQGTRMQITTEELLNQGKLQKKLVEVINKTFSPMKPNKWLSEINRLLATCAVMHEPEEASKKGQFFELLDSFLTGGVCGECKEDLLRHNTYKEDNTIYFRSHNLFTYLKNKRFNYIEKEVWLWMKDKDAKNKRIKIKSKNINVWSYPAPEMFSFEEDESDDKL